MSAMAIAAGLFSLQAGQLVLDRPLRAEPAEVGGAGRVEAAVGAWYVSSDRVDSIGTPFQAKWNVSDRWQLRIQSVGMTGAASTWLELSELRDIQLGAQFQFLGSRESGIDAAFRGLFVGLHEKKHRAILTGLFSKRQRMAEWDLNSHSRDQLPLTGTLALGSKIWAARWWGGAIGYVFEIPEYETARHRAEGSLLARPWPNWVFDLGGEVQFAPWTRVIFKGGLSFYIGKL